MNDQRIVRIITGSAVAVLGGITLFVALYSPGALILAAVYILFGVAFIIGKNWARVALLIAAVLSVVGGIIVYVGGSPAIGVVAILAWTLILIGTWYGRIEPAS